MRKTALTALGCLCCALALQAAAPKQKMAKFIQKEMDFAISQSMRMYDSVRDLDGRLVNTTRDVGADHAIRDLDAVPLRHPLQQN